MKIDDYPNLLIVTKLVEPLDISTNKVRKIKNLLQPDTEELFIQGVFVLSIASMEANISDVLRYYLLSFPQKLSADFKFEKVEFFINQFNLLERIIDNHLYKLSYESFESYLNKFLKYLSIEWDDFWNSFGKYLQEIKAIRNSLLHNELVYNDKYRECAGIAAREPHDFKVDYAYVAKSIDTILAFEQQLKERLLTIYREYTKINANKRLWKYMFKTPLMASYDDYWHYDEEKDSIPGFKKSQHEGGLSSSETMLLELWRTHFSGTYKNSLNMKHLVGETREKALFFLSIAGEFSFY